MLLLLPALSAALSSVPTAAAKDFEIVYSLCGMPPRPCIGILDSDAEIMPDDWLAAVTEDLHGELHYLRVALTVQSGVLDVYVNDVAMQEGVRSRSESTEELDVYYVPLYTTERVIVTAHNSAEEVAFYSLVVDGATQPVE